MTNHQFQHTLKEKFTVCGMGLHTGKATEMTVVPADVDSGIRFRRMDLPERPILSVSPDLVYHTERCTALEHNGIQIHTTEHILGALYGAGIDNATIELTASEPPILDGSAKEFMENILRVGVLKQNKKRAQFTVDKIYNYEHAESGAHFRIEPWPHLEIESTIDFPGTAIGKQTAELKDRSHFGKEIATARTFCFLHELEYLLANDLIKGGDISNALVFVNEELSEEKMIALGAIFGKPKMSVKDSVLDHIQLRFHNEAARHKLLDVVGDLALIGKTINAKITVYKPGHGPNTQFAQFIQSKLIISQPTNPKKPMPSFDIYKKPVFDINDIMKILPHRSPFLLVDKILELEETRIVGLKSVTMNEPFFEGHFPGQPVMPGVLQIEAMAQAGGVLVLTQVPDPENYLTYFLKIDKVKFKKMVVPGDVIVFELHLVEPVRRGLCVMQGKAYVGESLVMEADLMAQIKKVK